MRLKVKSLFKEWANSLLTEFSLEPEHVEFTSFEDQIEFIGKYIGFMLLDGGTRENLKRIEYFLPMQEFSEDNAEMMEIHFETDGNCRSLIRRTIC